MDRLLTFSIWSQHAKITPIAYDPECPFTYNNFVYKVTLASPSKTEHGAQEKPKQPGCVPVPPGTTAFVMRLTNPQAVGMNKRNRVENEVAIINFVSAALTKVHMDVVPSVFGWGSAATQPSQGWILQQLMPGTPLDEQFDAMDQETKSAIYAQMTKMLSAIQRYQLPPTITHFGGVTYDKQGHPISAPMTSVDAGPWISYEASFKERLQVALREADANPYIKGWRANGIRERLDAFIETGLATQFHSLQFANQKIVIHADFTTNNILYDATTKRITALLDYDFACISHPSYEFLRSFDGHGGQFRGLSNSSNSEQNALHHAKLHGFPTPLPKSTKDGVDWQLAALWEQHLEKADVLRPKTLDGIAKVADVDAILRGIMPWRVTNTDLMRMQSPEVTMKCRKESEEQLHEMLERLGFTGKK